MKLTIIPTDKSVYKDNIPYENLISLNQVPKNIHALQWIDVQGWLEFDDGTPNELITELPSWTTDIINEWDSTHTNELDKAALLNSNKVESLLTDAQKLAWIVDERNKRLASCDWTQLPDVIILHDDVWLNNWRVYRQALRDLPASVDINSPMYPIPPL
jgi:hypothetical protein